jgi:hypothetical protein
MTHASITHLIASKPLDRRTLLRGAGIALALPLLDRMQPPAFGKEAPQKSPTRMVAILTNMGILPQYFFPEGDGLDYQASPYLEVLEKHRENVTVFSGLSHPDVDGGHHADIAFLTGARRPGRAGFRNTISLDQYAADRVGTETRIGTLPLLVGLEGKRSLSWTANGVMVPSESKPSQVFKRLFLQGSPEEIADQVAKLREGRSILDEVSDRAKSLEANVGANDRRKLDQYFQSVREAEKKLQAAEAWQHRPKPKTNAKPPQDISDPADLIGKTRLMYEMTILALQSDSTRIVPIFIEEDHNPTVKVDGVTHGHHSLTHHGNRDDHLTELSNIEKAQFGALDELLTHLQSASEGAHNLLDRTAVLYGTNMGNANAHSNDNLPVLLAGGSFKHGSHLAFDRKKNAPLCNVFVSMLQHLGIESDHFASSTGTLTGLERKG